MQKSPSPETEWKSPGESERAPITTGSPLSRGGVEGLGVHQALMSWRHHRNPRIEPHFACPRPVVYLQHALFADNASWLLNQPNNSLGFLLADAGYDVWMGNSRGNTWSRRHETLSVEQEKFWSFSFDEMGKYDLPSIINFIVRKTGQRKLYFVGHSLGTTIGFITFTTKPEIARRIKMNFVLGPVASFKYPKSIFANFFFLPQSVIKAIWGNKGFLLEDSVKKTTRELCSRKISSWICSEFLNLWAGYDTKNMNVSRTPIYFSHSPTGTSIQNILHLKQLFHSDDFRAYDWGSKAENMRHYNQSIPPLYDLTTMKVPTAIWAGGKDLLVDPRDVAVLLPKIKNLRFYEMLPDWNHIDFIWALDSSQRVYSKILSLMKQTL